MVSMVSRRVLLFQASMLCSGDSQADRRSLHNVHAPTGRWRSSILYVAGRLLKHSLSTVERASSRKCTVHGGGALGWTPGLCLANVVAFKEFPTLNVGAI
jgi:hypothetical protein